MEVRAPENSIRLICNLGNGGGESIRADLQDHLGNVFWHKGEYLGAHNARPIIFFYHDLVDGVVQVPEMGG